MRNALPADRVRPDNYRGYSGGASNCLSAKVGGVMNDESR